MGIHVIKVVSPGDLRFSLANRALPHGFKSMREKLDRALKADPHFDERTLVTENYRIFGRNYVSGVAESRAFLSIPKSALVPLFYTTFAMNMGKGPRVAIRKGDMRDLISFCRNNWDPQIRTSKRAGNLYLTRLDRAFPIEYFGKIEDKNWMYIA